MSKGEASDFRVYVCGDSILVVVGCRVVALFDGELEWSGEPDGIYSCDYDDVGYDVF